MHFIPLFSALLSGVKLSWAGTMTPWTAVSILLLFAASGFVAAITDGLLPNGNFELGPSPSQLNGTRITDRYALPEWEISGFVQYIRSGQKKGDMNLVVPEGAFAAGLGNEASIKQQLNVTPGTFYSLTLGAARTCAQQERLNVSVTPEFDLFPIQTVYSSNGWDSYAWGFEAKVAVVDLVIHNPGVEEDPACGPVIDSVAIKTLHPPRRTNLNLLKNGDLEEGPYIIPKTSWGVLFPPEIEDKHSPLPGWMVESLKAVKCIDSDHFFVPHGLRAVELVAGRESVLAQVVRTVPGRVYDLTFFVGDARNACLGSMVVEAFADRESVKVSYQSTGSGGFERARLRFTASGGRARIAFYSSFYHTRVDGTLCGPVVDDVTLLSVRGASILG